MVVGLYLVVLDQAENPSEGFTHQEDKSGNGRVAIDANKGESLGQMSLASTHKEEPGAGEDASVETPEGGERHEDGHHVDHHSQNTASERLREESEGVYVFCLFTGGVGAEGKIFSKNCKVLG